MPVRNEATESPIVDVGRAACRHVARGCILAIVLSSVGCDRSDAASDGVPMTDGGSIARDASSTDAGHDAGSIVPPRSDGGPLSCYPVNVNDYWSGRFGPWLIGERRVCDVFGFAIESDRFEEAEVFLGHQCVRDTAWGDHCPIAIPYSGPVTAEEYELICEVEARFGPRQWDCIYLH